MRYLIAITFFCLMSLIQVPDWASSPLSSKSQARFENDIVGQQQPLGSMSVFAKNTSATTSAAAKNDPYDFSKLPDDTVASLDGGPADGESSVPMPPRRPVSYDEVCDTVTAAAESNGLPVPFFIRLIWQESRFDERSVSHAGAQGMAQFMPATAADMGLADPFNPLEAVRASARMLRGLFNQFGNLGLAAAAYNAGAGRIQNWISKKGDLPQETRRYVLNVTGRAPEHWKIASAGPATDLRVPQHAPCHPDDAVLVASIEVPDPGHKTAKPHGKHFIAHAKPATKVAAQSKTVAKVAAKTTTTVAAQIKTTSKVAKAEPALFIVKPGAAPKKAHTIQKPDAKAVAATAKAPANPSRAEPTRVADVAAKPMTITPALKHAVASASAKKAKPAKGVEMAMAGRGSRK